MARMTREIEPDVIYHVMNRGNNRGRIFHKAADYEAFLTVLTIALSRFDVELLCWCVMPNHWHLVLRPKRTGALSEFMQWLTMTHVRRYYEHYTERSGHLYQGRFNLFPVETDDYFLVLCRYVEANALRAKLVDRAEDWQWSSLWQRRRKQATPPLAKWPVDRPDRWVEIVNESLPADQEAAVQASLNRQRPLGTSSWIAKTARRLGIEQTLKKPGPPPKPESELSKRQQRRRRSSGGHNRT